MLKEVGLEDAWPEVNTNHSDFIVLYKKKLHYQCIESWRSCINDVVTNPLLYLYRLYKSNFSSSAHLYLSNPKLRSSHNLKIETGRHTKPKTPRNDRLCILCSLNAVEDELHALLICTAYAKERQPLLNHIFQIDPLFNSYNIMGQFLVIMHSDDIHTLGLLGKLLVYIFKQVH